MYIQELTMAVAPVADVVSRSDHKSNPIGPAIWFALIFVILLNTIFINARVYCQVRVTKDFGRDDLFAVIGAAFLIPTLIICAAGLQYIRNVSELTYDQLVGRDMSLYAQSILYNPSYLFLKVSIILQFLRLLHPTSKRDWMWWACWTTIVLVSIYYFIYLFLEIFNCDPIQGSFLPDVKGAKCRNNRNMRIVSSAFNAITDVIMVLIPQPTIWHLQMRRTQKIKTSLIFFVGFIAITASVAKLAINIINKSGNDTANYSIVIGVTSYVELTAILICSCLPYTMKLLKKIKTRKATTQNSTQAATSPTRSHKKTPSSDIESQISDISEETLVAGRFDHPEPRRSGSVAGEHVGVAV